MLELYVHDPAVTALDGFMLVGLFLTVLNNRNVLLVHPGQASKNSLTAWYGISIYGVTTYANAIDAEPGSETR